MPIQEGGTFSPDPQVVSPGVFTREFDQSGVAAGVANIGGVVVAPFPSGPAFAPTVFTNINQLQAAFGIPDGVYYGPYTATQYLQEQGSVTVTRVGGLTGYNQNFPFVIYAQSGSWNRNGSIGNLNSGSSFAFLSGSLSKGFTEGFSVVSANQIQLASASLTVTFQPLAADDTNYSINSQSGSILYAGQTISLGITNLPLTVNANLTTGSNFSSSVIAGTFTGSINEGVLLFTGGTYPFESVTIFSGGLKSVLGNCNAPSFEVSGILSGSFGQYNGTFTAAGSITFDPCTNTWSSGSSDMKILAVLNDTQYGGIQNLTAPGFSGSSLATATSFPSNAIGNQFNLTLKNSNSTTPYGVYNFSLSTADSQYITNVFGSNPTAGNPSTQISGQKIEAAYLYNVYENAIAAIVANNTNWKVFGAAAPDGVNLIGNPETFTDSFSFAPSTGDSQFAITNATTPWIFSQKIAPWQAGAQPTRFRLFQVATLSDGTDTNTRYKVEISNVRLAGTVPGTNWGTFTLSVRSFSDTDKKPVYLEQFPNCTMDPTSANFVARLIGDRYNFINADGKIVEFGTFSNNSNYIRIVMNTSPYPETVIPYGFEALVTPINSSAGYWTPTVKYTKASVYGLNPGKYPSGITFGDAPVGADAELRGLYPTSSFGNGAASDNLQYFAPLPVFGAYPSTGRNIQFALDDDYEQYGVGIGSFLSGSNAVPTIFDAVNEPTYVRMRKFVLGFQGGFDGQSPAIPINVGENIAPGNTQGLDCTTSTSAGSIAYNQAISALGNADEFDINLIVTPGIIHEDHPYVTNLTVDMCEKRGDVFYILDLYVDSGNPASGQIDQVVSFAAEYDTNYAAAYYPWVKILDTNINQIVTVPPSVIMPGV